MHCMTLNTWGGRAGKEGLLSFLRAHKETDIFCLQEVWSDAYEHLEGVPAGGVVIDHRTVMTNGVADISSALPDHEPFFHPHHGDNYGLMMLVKKSLPVLEVGDVFVYKERGFIPDGDVGRHARNIQYVTIDTGGGVRTIMNFHGLWNGRGKGDSDERIEQSERIIEFLKTFSHPYILCGDFNLLPHTVSLKKLEDFGLRNLVAEYGVTSTRTRHYAKQEKYADYVFVGTGIVIDDFCVLPDEVSDHAPLLVDFS